MKFLTGTALATILLAGSAYAADPAPLATPADKAPSSELEFAADRTPEPASPPSTPSTPRAPRSTTSVTVTDGEFGSDENTVRMVIDRLHEDGTSGRQVCVWVPTEDNTGGALSCDGSDVRVFSFGGEDGEQIIIDGEVVSGNEIRRMVEDRLAAVSDALAGMGNWEFEWVDEFFDSSEFEREMEDLSREMEDLQNQMEMDFRELAYMDDEERAEFQQEMREYEREMRDLAREMAELNSELRFEFIQERADAEQEARELAMEREDLRHEMETLRRTFEIESSHGNVTEQERREFEAEMRELDREMARLDRDQARLHPVPSVPRVPPIPPMTDAPFGTHWFTNNNSTDRQIIRIDQSDGPSHMTVIETVRNEEGMPQIVIRTTDPGSVRVIEMDEDEIEASLDEPHGVHEAP